MKTFALVLLLSSCVYAGDVTLSAGLGFDHPGRRQYSDLKYIEAGYQDTFYKRFAYHATVGGWTDSTGYLGAQDSGQFSCGVGIKPEWGPFSLSYFLGPALITNPDSLLGSNFQIVNEFQIAVMDAQGFGMALFAKHFSNAGIWRPNYGRNFAGLRLIYEIK